MCGIAGFYLKDPDFVKTDEDHQKMETFLNNLLVGIQPRGDDATGFVAQTFEGKGMVLDKNAVPASDFIKKRKALPKGTRTVLGHTRFATKGLASNWFNNHPVMSKSVFVTHNGMISNDDRLFKEKKWTRNAEVDSEAIAALISSEGWDDLDNIFKTLRGGYAVAAIDLLKAGELLLFKGPSWPLAYHENKNFVVWASQASVIINAWGNVLGTPPTLAKFDHLAEREAVRIKDGEVSFVEAPKSTYSRSSSSHRTPHSWETQWENEEDYDWASYGTCETPWHLDRNSGGEEKSVTASVSIRAPKLVKDNSLQIALMRADGLGKCITWKAEKAGKLTEDQKAGFNGNWDYCNSCTESIAKNDMLNTLAWGRICLDCHSFLSNPVNEGNEPEMPSSEVFNNLPMIDELEAWVEIESKIYYQSLLTISDDTGLQTATVDYLLQRVSPRELRLNPPMRELKDEIHAAYEDAENKAWEDYSKETLEQTDDIWESPQKCASMNQISQKCAGCEFCIIDVEVIEEEETGVEPFAENIYVTCAAGTHTTMDQCDACDAGRPNYSSPATRVSTRASKPKVITPKSLTAEKAPGQCMTGKCRKKSKVELITGKGKYRWCYPHYTKCSELGCQEDTRGCKPTGERLCHRHFRGTEGGIQDIIKVKNASEPTPV